MQRSKHFVQLYVMASDSALKIITSMLLLLVNVILFKILLPSSYPYPTKWDRYNMFFIML
jgi:hypothetical protein